MILGIGTDIVEIGRIAEALERHGERFARRILGEEELLSFRASAQQAQFLAKRFAAKEAVAKAFGTGFRDGLGMRDICVTHNELGRPELSFSGRALELSQQLGVAGSHISLSDERHYAVAFVTLSRA